MIKLDAIMPVKKVVVICSEDLPLIEGVDQICRPEGLWDPMNPYVRRADDIIADCRKAISADVYVIVRGKVDMLQLQISLDKVVYEGYGTARMAGDPNRSPFNIYWDPRNQLYEAVTSPIKAVIVDIEGTYGNSKDKYMIGKLEKFGIVIVLLKGPLTKSEHLSLISTLNLDTEVAYIGDDDDDLPYMKQVANGCPADASRNVKFFSSFISEYKGGEGAVRDFLEHLFDSSLD
jgi:hypothetical protein